MSFSLKRTIKSLLWEYSSGSGEITCIHGIRSLATIALYIAHKLIPLSRIPYSNRIALTEVRMSSEYAKFILREGSDVWFNVGDINCPKNRSQILRSVLSWESHWFTRIPSYFLAECWLLTIWLRSWRYAERFAGSVVLLLDL